MRVRVAGAALAIALAGGARGEDERTTLAPEIRAAGVAVSADGSLLAVLDADGAVHLLDPADGTESARLEERDRGRSVAFVGRDASTVATFGEGVNVWKVAKKSVRRLEAPEMPAKERTAASHVASSRGFGAAASLRDPLVAVAGADRKVSFWSATTEREVGAVEAGGHGLAAVFSPDGSRFAALVHKLGGGRTVVVVDVQRRTVLWKIEITDFDRMQKDPGRPLIGWTGLAFSPDGRTLFAKCGDPRLVDGSGKPDTRETAVRAYDLTKKAERWTRRLEDTFVREIACSPAGDRLAAVTLGGVQFLDTATGATAATLGSEADASRTAAYSPDGKRLFTAGAAAGVVRWELPEPSGADAAPLEPRLATAAVKFRGSARDIAISPDGATLAALETDGTRFSPPTRVRVYDLAKGTLKRESTSEKAPIDEMGLVGPAGDLVACRGREGRAWVWSIASGERVAVLDDHLIRESGATATYAVARIAASRATREVAVAFDSAAGGAPVVAVVDPVTSRLVRVPVTTEGVRRVLAVAFSADGLRLAVVTAGDGVALELFRRADAKAAWEASSLARTEKLGAANLLWWHEVAFTSDMLHVVARTDIGADAGGRAVVVIWRTDAAADPWIGATKEKNGGLGLAPSPRGDGFAVSAFDGAFLVDPGTGATNLRLPGTRTLPSGLAFSPDGRRLYASLDQDLVTWDLGEKK